MRYTCPQWWATACPQWWMVGRSMRSFMNHVATVAMAYRPERRALAVIVAARFAMCVCSSDDARPRVGVDTVSPQFRRNTTQTRLACSGYAARNPNRPTELQRARGRGMRGDMQGGGELLHDGPVTTPLTTSRVRDGPVQLTHIPHVYMLNTRQSHM